jgi:hypothetical protein
MPIPGVASPALLGGKIELIPPHVLRLWRQRCGGLTTDTITADADKALAPPRPKRRNDVGRTRAPIEAAKDSFRDIHGVHQGDDVKREHRWLTVPKCVGGKEARRPVATQVGDDHSIARRRQQRCHVDITVNIVWPSVQQNDRLATGGACFGIGNGEEAGVNLPQGDERLVRPRRDRGEPRLVGLRVNGTSQIKLSGGKRYCRGGDGRRLRGCRLLSLEALRGWDVRFVGSSEPIKSCANLPRHQDPILGVGVNSSEMSVRHGNNVVRVKPRGGR